jgi:hypothetical protein
MSRNSLLVKLNPHSTDVAPNLRASQRLGVRIQDLVRDRLGREWGTQRVKQTAVR